MIAGAGSLEEALRRRAATLPNVRFAGHVPRTELAHLYSRARAVVMPSIGHETCGLAMLEAHAHGVPVIASNHGAMREIVNASGGGLLFGDSDELDSAIGRLAGDDVLRSELGRNARDGYVRNWTLDRHLTRYLALVGELDDARRAALVA